MTIDTTKPMELVDGRPVRFLHFDRDGDLVVEVKGDESGMDRVFHHDGRDFFGELPDLRNIIDEPQCVMVIPRTIDEWVAFNGDVPDKHWSFTLDVLDALGLILPDAPKSPVSRAQRFEQETGIRAGKKVLAALEWAANNPE